MCEDFAKVATVATDDRINLFLDNGWKVINSQFCLIEDSPNNPKVRQFIPYALMGLPISVASERASLEFSRRETPEFTAPSIPAEAPMQNERQPIGSRIRESSTVEENNVETPVEEKQSTPSRGRPAGRTSVNQFMAAPDLSRSEETMIGVRK